MYKFEKHIVVLYSSFKLLQKHNCFINKNSNVSFVNSGNNKNLKLLNYFINLIYLYQFNGKRSKLIQVKKSISNFKIFKNDFIFLKSTLRKDYFFNFLKIFQYNSNQLTYRKKNFNNIGIGITNLIGFKKILNILLNYLNLIPNSLKNVGKSINFRFLNKSLKNLYKI